MVKVINTKKYDTQTAKEVGYYENGYNRNDFNFCSETLYIKKTGEYFLHGEGGPMSSYAVHSGNETSSGEMIKPLNYEQARSWSEKYLSGEDYINIFGDIEEDYSKKALTLNLNVSDIEKLKRYSSANDITMSDIISKLISELKI